MSDTTCGKHRPGRTGGIGRHRLPCILPADHAGEHQSALLETWEGSSEDAEPTPVAVPKRLSVRTDADMAEDLTVLSEAGWTPTDAIRYGLRVLADAHRGGLEVGFIQRGERVDVVATTLDRPVWGTEAKRLGEALRSIQ